MNQPGKRRHIVPQQMIRRFANEQKLLYYLDKADLRVGTRPRPPGSVLFRDNYYVGRVTDVDLFWLQPIEDRFGKTYPILADGPVPPARLTAAQSDAFLDWSIALLCRTGLLGRMTQVASARSHGPSYHQLVDALGEDFRNLMRYAYYRELRHVFASARARWMFCQFNPDENLVITDHPVCTVNAIGSAHAPLLLVPISRKRIAICGSTASVEMFRQASLLDINLFLAAWAEDRVYAADRQTLEQLAATLSSADGSYRPEFLEAARQPLFGLPTRMAKRPPPSDIEASTIFEDLKRWLSDGGP